MTPTTWAEIDYSKGRNTAYADVRAGLCEVVYDPEAWDGRKARSVALDYREAGVRNVVLVKTERIMVGTRAAVRRTYTVDGCPL